MDGNGGQRDHGSHRVDYYRGVHTLWNTMPQYQTKDANATFMSKEIMRMIAERDNAIEERNKAMTERNAAVQERNEAIKQRDEAVAARDTAFRERDSAIAALRFHENYVNGILGYGIQRRTKRSHHQTNHPSVASETAFNRRVAQTQTNDSFPTSEEGVKPRPAKRGKGNKAASKVSTKPLKKGKKVGEDLNSQVTTNGSKAEWDAQDQDLINQIDFDDYSMPPPVCSCTGLLRQCYKWGNGGWQSACCTTTLSQYPLPQIPNRRHARMGGRKMSGTVFARLLTRLVGEGHDLSVPLDLRNYWAKHGTNRYITIK